MTTRSRIRRWLLCGVMGLVLVPLFFLLGLLAYIGYESYDARSKAAAQIEVWKKDSTWVRFKDIAPLMRDSILAAEASDLLDHSVPTPKSMIDLLLEHRESDGLFSIAARSVSRQDRQQKRHIIWTIDQLAVTSMLTSNFEDAFEVLYNRSVIATNETGVEIHGFENGARHIFHKSAHDLSWAEGALLAGMLKSPSLFDPRKNPERSKHRRDWILDRLATLVPLDPKALTEAKAEPLPR